MKTTLFDQLGGRDGISTIVDDTVNNHMKNPFVSARFLPLKDEPERLAIVKNHTIDFFSAGSGGPAQYTGKDMVGAHTGMNISPGEYLHVIDDIMKSLDQNHITDEAKKEVLAVLWSLKGMIISK
jgi:hemoglobin